MDAWASFLCNVSGQKTFDVESRWALIFDLSFWGPNVSCRHSAGNKIIDTSLLWSYKCMRGSQKLSTYDDIKTVNIFVALLFMHLFDWRTSFRSTLSFMFDERSNTFHKQKRIWMMVVLVKLSNQFYFGDKHLELKDSDGGCLAVRLIADCKRCVTLHQASTSPK